MATTQVQVVINAKDNASKVLNGIGKNLKGFGKSASSVGRDLSVGLTAPIVATGFAITKLVERAGKVQSVTDAFEGMIKTYEIGGSELVSNIKKATSGTIDQFKIMQNFMKASTLIGQEALGKSGKNFERFAVIAKKAARATGQDVDFLFESIVNGIGRTSTKWLDNTGIVVSATNVYADYAEELGKTVKELTETEKKIALTNAFLAKAEKQYEDVAVTAGGYSSSLARLKVSLQESADEIGMSLIPAIQGVVEAITPLIKEHGPRLAKMISGIAKSFSELSPRTQSFIIGAIALTAVLGPLLMVIGTIISTVGAIVAVFNPVTLAILAIAVATAFWISQFKKSKEIIVQQWIPAIKKIGNVITGLVDLIVKGDFTGKLGRALGISEDSPIIAGILGFRKKIITTFQKVADAITGFVDLIVKGDFTGKFGRALGISEDSPIIAGILTIRRIITNLGETFGLLFDIFRTGDFTRVFGEFFNVAEDSNFVSTILGIRDAFLNLIEQIKGLPERIVKFFIEDIPFAIGFLVGRFEKFVNEDIPRLAEQFILWVENMLIRSWEAFVNFATVTVPQAITSLIEWLAVAIPTLGERFVQWIQDMATGAWNALIQFKDNAVATLTDMKNRAIAIVTDLYNRFVAWIKQLVTDVTIAMNELPGNIVAAMQKVKEAAISKAKEIYEGVRGWFDKIVGFFGDIIGKAGEAISRAKEAFGLGIEAGQNFHTGGVIPGPVGADVPIMAQAGEKIIPAGAAATSGGDSGGGVTFNVSIGLYAGTETEKRTIAEDLYAALVRTGISQNKSVAEMMGG